MGSSPGSSVTNGELQVHGVENLFLCTAGVFPTAGAVNPTLTIAALAHRLGDHLSQRA